MKKLILLISIIAAACMFSSCIIVAADQLPEIVVEEPAKPSNTPTYVTTPAATFSITCKNKTSYTVTDWCVQKDNIRTFANGSDNRNIRPGCEDMILSLEQGYYKVYFSFADVYQLQPDDYYNSESIYLNKDVIYTLYERQVTVSCRSAAADTKPQLYLAGSDGSEIELVCEQ